MKEKTMLLILVSMLLTQSCYKTSKEVPELEPLPIDGTWYMESVPLNRIRIEKGRLIQLGSAINAVSPAPGSVVLSALKEISPGIYQGLDNSVLFPIKMKVNTVDIDKIKYIHRTWLKESVDDEIAYNNLLYQLKYLDKKSFIDITSKYTREKVSSELIEIPVGSIMKIKRSRMLENRVIYSAINTDGDITEKGEFSFSEGALIKYLEENYQYEVKQSEKIEHEITLDGTRAQKYTITWYDKLRNGEINTYVKGEWQNIPFKFKEWAEIEVKAIK